MRAIATLLLFVCSITQAQSQLVSSPCPDSRQASVQVTPVELYRLAAGCASEGQYDDAINYFALAGVFGRYDTYRVHDVSAHQISGILKDESLTSIPVANKIKFQKLAGEAFGNKEKHEALCQYVKTIGYPTYEPTYMKNHGISAITGPSTAEGAPIQVEESWSKALSSYLSCA